MDIARNKDYLRGGGQIYNPEDSWTIRSKAWVAERLARVLHREP